MTSPTETIRAEIEKVRERVLEAGPADCWEGFIHESDYLLDRTVDMLVKAPTDISRLLSALECACEALERAPEIINDDFLVSTTDDGEKQHWVNHDQLERVCEEATATIAKLLGEG